MLACAHSTTPTITHRITRNNTPHITRASLRVSQPSVAPQGATIGAMVTVAPDPSVKSIVFPVCICVYVCMYVCMYACMCGCSAGSVTVAHSQPLQQQVMQFGTDPGNSCAPNCLKGLPNVAAGQVVWAVCMCVACVCCELCMCWGSECHCTVPCHCTLHALSLSRRCAHVSLPNPQPLSPPWNVPVHFSLR
jgi:hypothetical protein